MLKSYLTIAWRNLRRNRSYALINATGLALGLACCVLIALFVRDELSYDRFHEKAERIMFVGMENVFGRGTATPYPLAGALESEVPEVEETVRTLWPGAGEVSRDGQQFSEEDNVFHAEAGFFEVFSFPLIRGDAAAALSRPNTAVISEELAQKYFPGEDPIGKTLHARERGDHTYEITGVAQSRGNSYLDFGAVLSFATLDYEESHGDSWRANMFLTFAVLEEGVSKEQFDAQALELAKAHLGEDTESTFFAEPITGLYLSDLVSVEGFRGERRYIYIFGAVALFTLLIACVNYMNLATARSAQRAREVGVRKTVGASRGQVAGQFLGEAVLLSAGAFLLALLLAQLALPVFNTLFDKSLVLFGPENVPFLLLMAAVALGVGVLAGSYPALYLSGFRPVEVLRGRTARGPSGAALRKGLVVFQFAIAVALIACTAIVWQQLRFTQTKNLGFQGEQVMLVELPDDEQGEAFRQSALAHSGVVSTTVAWAVPGRFRSRLAMPSEAIAPAAEVDPEKSITFSTAVVDYDYVETLGLRLVAGRDFSREHSADEQEAYIFNETAARELGWTPEEAVGKSVNLGSDTPGEVIGVVEDFHTESLHTEIAPVALQLREGEGWSSSSMLAARLAPEAISQARRHIERQWARFSDEPFTYSFLDEEFAQQYRTERRLGQVFSAFAFIAILIACLGLFGLAAFAAERRTKEIGIRKVLGASAAHIVGLLSKEFLALVLAAFVLAAPVAYFAMSRWLESFAYRIDLGPWVFVLAGATALVIALLTVSSQALRAALMDPVKAIRYE